VDLLLCLGWFYHPNVLDTRVAAANRTQGGGEVGGLGVWGEDGVLWPEKAVVVPHEKVNLEGT
jgi:hypothetical protein